MPSLRAISLLITKGTTPTAAQGGFATSGINYIKSESLNYDGVINQKAFAFIDASIHEDLKRSQIRENDILYSIAGHNLGKCGVATADMLPANTNQAVAIIRINSDLADPRFVSYFLRNPTFVRRVLAGVAQSAQPNVNLADVGSFDIPDLSIATQRVISGILGSLDDKIGLNRKMTTTLEAMAQNIFTSMFRGFEPVGEDNKNIPPGWAFGAFSDVCRIQKTTIKPMTAPEELFEHFSLPAFDNGKRTQLELGSSIKSAKFAVSDSAVLVSKLNPVIERVWLANPTGAGTAVGSTEFLPLEAKPPFTRAYVYCISRSIAFRQKLATLVTGTSTSHQRVNLETTLDIPVLLPPRSAIEEFDRVVEPILRRVLSAESESVTLDLLRDNLLPKLISGELRVAQAANILERSA